MGMVENTRPGESVKLGSYKLPLPRSRMLRMVLGVFGFLPVLGFWMIPLGLLILSVDLPRVRRGRRRFAVWFARRYPDLARRLHVRAQENGNGAPRPGE